jgi:flagellar biosynthesis GTPase FlhF
MPNKQPAAPVKSHSAANPPGTSKPAASQLPVANIPPALKLAEVEAMSQSDRIALFQAKDVAAGRIFIDLGKLYTGIEAKLGKGEQIFPLLMKAGVRKGSVSNASQTSRVFKEMVIGKAIMEETFDTFRWGDICALNRVMSGASRRKLTAAEAAKVIAANPKRFDEEFESLFLTGFTLAEADKAAKEQAAAEKKAQDEKAEAEKKAAGERVVAEKKAAAEKAAADALAAKAAADKQKADEAVAKAKTAADKAAAEAAKKKAEDDSRAAAIAQKKAAENASVAARTEPSPGKITPLPPQNTVTLTTCGEQLDKLLESIAKLPIKQQVAFYTTTWKAADSLLADSLKGHLKKSA